MSFTKTNKTLAVIPFTSHHPTTAMGVGQVMQGFYLFLYIKGVFVFSHLSTGVIRCANSLFPIEELLSILCSAGAILREAIFVMDRLCPLGVRINLRDSRRASS